MSNRLLEQQQQLQAQTMMVQIQADMFTRLRTACIEKCHAVAAHPEAEMSGAALDSCVDACVDKYVQVHEIVDMLFQQQNNRGGGMM